MTIHEKWEKNPAYPLQFGECKECGHSSMVKLAWDLRGYLCLDAKQCLERVSIERARNLPHYETPVIETIQPQKTYVNKSGKLQYFTCQSCTKEWSRPSTRGKPPKTCPECR